MDRPPLIETEVLPPEPSGAPPPRLNPGGTGAAGASRAVVEVFHPAAAAMLVLVDNFWMLPEFAVATLWITVPLCFLSVFVITFVIQRRFGRNAWAVAFAKALFFAVVAAVPFSVTGTPVGLAFLAWAGVKRLRL